MITDILRGIIKIRFYIFGLIVLLAVISIFLIKGLNVESDILEYMPATDEDVRFFKEIGNKYLSNYFIMVTVEAPEDMGVFKKEYIEKIDRLTKAYKNIEGVSSVISLTNIMDIKKIEDGIDVASLIEIDNLENLTEEGLRRLSSYVLSHERYVNNIVSRSGRYSQIIMRPYSDTNRETVVEEVERLSKEILYGSALKYYAGGWPVAIREMNNAIIKDMSGLTPIVIIISTAVLFLGFRTIRGVILPILVVIIANLFTFALMAIMKKPITMGTSSIPVILVSTGTAYAIHIINQYYFHSTRGISKEDIVFHAVSDKWKAVLLSALTTMVGFTTLTTATLNTVVDLGIFMTSGIFFAFVIAILILPLILYSLPARQTRKVISENEELAHTRGIFLPYIERLVLNHSKKIVVMFFLITILLLPSLFRLSADVNPINYFRREASIRKSEQILMDHFGGAVPIYILVKGEVKDPVVMYVTEYVERLLEAEDLAGNVQSVASVVADLNYNLIGDYSIPDNARKIGNLWFFVEGNEYLSQYVTSDMDESVILARIRSMHRSKVVQANNNIAYLLKRVPRRYKLININDYRGDLRNRLTYYIERHIRDRLLTEIRIAGGDADATEVESMIQNIFKGNYENQIPGLIDCSELNSEFAKRFSRIMAEYKIDYRLAEEDIDKCDIDILNRIKIISGKTVVEDDELESEILHEIHGIKIDLIEHYKRVRIESAVKERFGRYNLSQSAMKHIMGILTLSLRDHVVIGEDFDGFSELREEAREIQMRYGGLGPILNMLDDNLMKNQIQSIILAMLLVFLLMLYLTRSPVISLVSMIPISFTLLVNFAGMAIFGIVIDDITIMIASILIGVGIDYTIHTITGLKLGSVRYGDDKKAISFTIRVVGRAIFLNTTAVALGFISLVFGDFVPLRTAGILIAVTMFVAAVSAIVLIPSFVMVYSRFNIKEVRL